MNLDDREYILENPWVSGGLTRDSMMWALTADVAGDSEYADYWQPVTLISRLVDGSLYGLNPAGHHLTSLLIHLANAVLLLLLLATATGRLWRSALVALIFATHPIHVSSVVWLTERKDVLSGFFSLVSIAIFARFAAAYRGHLERRGDEATGGRVIGWYLLLAAGYALCLMSKPMTLPLPLVLLLVAVWPIPRERRPGLLRLALALTPLLLLAAIAFFLYSQVNIARSEFEQFAHWSPLSTIGVIVTSLAAYPARLLYPANLQHIYAVHPGSVPAWQVAGSLLLLGAATTVSSISIRRRPFLAVGWLWYLVSLLPVVAIFLTSPAADRFAYFPLIGVTVMIVWGLGELAPGRWPASRAIAAAAAVIALVLTTRAECRHWKDSITLFSHLLEHDPNHDVAHWHLGTALSETGDNVRALESLHAALAARPNFPTHSYNVGVVLERLGRLDEARQHYAEAVRLDPGYWEGYNGLGMTLWGLGRTAEAEAKFREAIRLNPSFAPARYNLGLILGAAGKDGEALAHFQEALALNPKDEEARRRIKVIIERQRRETDSSVVR